MENGKNLIHSFNHIDSTEGNFKGLTKREYFAGLAMQAMITNAPNGHLSNFKEGVNLAIQWSDELLKQLEK
jgi:hypothetical protein